MLDPSVLIRGLSSKCKVGEGGAKSCLGGWCWGNILVEGQKLGSPIFGKGGWCKVLIKVEGAMRVDVLGDDDAGWDSRWEGGMRWGDGW